MNHTEHIIHTDHTGTRDRLLSVIVPCYNSQDYMENAIRSLLVGGEETEILIVDDGSTDQTGKIADSFADRYPEIIRVIHKENGGHGDAVMAGLRQARGLYFKVVDSDDWLDGAAYQKVLDALKTLSEQPIDLLISNFIYDKAGKRRKHVTQFSGVLPEDRVFGWEDVGHFHWGQYIMMHCVIYRTELLRECNLQLPPHTFYVDNLYVYQPLKSVRRMYYVNVDLYHYFIGREGQSVQEDVLVRRVDQMLTMNRLVITAADPYAVPEPAQRDYMLHFLEIICAATTVILYLEGSEERLRQERELWAFLKETNPKAYHDLSRRLIGIFIHIPGRLWRRVVVNAYRLAQRIYGYN